MEGDFGGAELHFVIESEVYKVPEAIGNDFVTTNSVYADTNLPPETTESDKVIALQVNALFVNSFWNGP